MLILASSHSLGPVFAGFFCGAAVSRPAARFVVSFPISRVFRAQMLILASSCSLVPVLAGFHCGAAVSRPAVRYVVSFSLPRAFLCSVVHEPARADSARGTPGLEDSSRQETRAESSGLEPPRDSSGVERTRAAKRLESARARSSSVVHEPARGIPGLES